MFKKYLIVASKLDKAGINITTNLSQFRSNPLISSMVQQPSFDFYLVDKEIIYDENIDMEKIDQYDFIIFASKHESTKKEKTLSIHTTGNWREAQYGGKKGKISMASALFNKILFENLIKNHKEHDLKEYKVSLEATHHGPLIKKPCLFIEIGATEKEWTDRRAAFVIAKTISETIDTFQENSNREIAIAIGGPHYCPNFNKIQENSNYAISHVIAQYAFPLTEEMIKEAVENTFEEVDCVLLDWKGLGNEDHRKIVKDILDKLYLHYKKTSDIEK